jgi:hypothetical protein
VNFLYQWNRKSGTLQINPIIRLDVKTIVNQKVCIFLQYIAVHVILFFLKYKKICWKAKKKEDNSVNSGFITKPR